MFYDYIMLYCSQLTRSIIDNDMNYDPKRNLFGPLLLI